tara:strand:+ start:4948 stop:6999 length:2052 start_codon:yes stop_codon:yes gene_type:complete
MNNFRLEQESRSDNEIVSIELSRLENVPTQMQEFASIRFCCDKSPTKADVFVGSVKLNCFEEDDQLIYSLDGADYPFFKQLFINNFGKIAIQIWSNSELCASFFVELSSTKITMAEQQLWLEKIQSVFPMSNVGDDFSPMSNIKVDFSNQYGFFSFSSFANELQKFLVGQAKNFERPGFLKAQFSHVTSIGNTAGMDQTKHHLWLSSHMLWKKTKPTLGSLVQQNFMAYEPIKYPSKKTVTNYNTDLNRRLLLRLKEASVLLGKFLYDCKMVDARHLELRTNFETSSSKVDLVQIIRTRLQLCNDIIGKLIDQLERLGVNTTSGKIGEDSRFGQLTQSIMSLEYLLMPLRTLSILSNSLLAIPSNDVLFEYFCFALVVESLQAQGFAICEIGTGSPLPFYLKLSRKKDNFEITIFYDQQIPKMDRNEYYHPLVDKNRSTSAKRPDFIFHLKGDRLDTTFIADAKFKKLKKCLTDNFGTQLNSDHIVGKYTSGISQLGSFGRPPFFILGLCLADEVQTNTEYHSSLHNSVELFSKNSPLVQSGAIAIGYESTERIRDFFSQAIDFHKLLAENMPYSEPLVLEIPKEEKRHLINYSQPQKNKKFVDSSQRKWSHTAPTLTVDDAAEIKAMLKRGDKPQDIALYFGVNNGRISEIKSGAKFQNVTPKKSNLSPAGPYPALRNLLDF